jgi:hypothetical protein
VLYSDGQGRVTTLSSPNFTIAFKKSSELSVDFEKMKKWSIKELFSHGSVEKWKFSDFYYC